MKAETGRLLGPIVKGKHFHALKQYAEERIEWYHKQMESEIDSDKLRFYQGAIKELRRVETLDVEAEEAARRDN